MDVRFYLKRLASYLLIFTVPSLLLGPLLLSGYTYYNLSLSLFFEGILLIIFGGCLGTSLVEGYATMRYGVNPAVTRDTRQHFSERRSQQTASALVFLSAGAIILAVALLLLGLAPLLLH